MVVLFHGGLLLRQVEFCGCFSFEFLEFHPLRVSKSCTLLKLHCVCVCVCSSMCSCVGLYSNVYIILRVALSVQPAQFQKRPLVYISCAICASRFSRPSRQLDQSIPSGVETRCLESIDKTFPGRRRHCHFEDRKAFLSSFSRKRWHSLPLVKRLKILKRS